MCKDRSITLEWPKYGLLSCCWRVLLPCVPVAGLRADCMCAKWFLFPRTTAHFPRYEIMKVTDLTANLKQLGMPKVCSSRMNTSCWPPIAHTRGDEPSECCATQLRVGSHGVVVAITVSHECPVGRPSRDALTTQHVAPSTPPRSCAGSTHSPHTSHIATTPHMVLQARAATSCRCAIHPGETSRRHDKGVAAIMGRADRRQLQS